MSNITRYTPVFTTRPSLLGHSVFDTLFNDIFHGEQFANHLTQSTKGYPVADIYTNDDGATVMEFALAGFSRSELSIDVQPERRSITVSAQSADGEYEGSRRIARRSFTKTYVNYDDNLDLSRAEARFENGLLTVTVPARPEIQPLNIEIQ